MVKENIFHSSLVLEKHETIQVLQSHQNPNNYYKNTLGVPQSKTVIVAGTLGAYSNNKKNCFTRCVSLWFSRQWHIIFSKFDQGIKFLKTNTNGID